MISFNEIRENEHTLLDLSDNIVSGKKILPDEQDESIKSLVNNIKNHINDICFLARKIGDRNIYSKLKNMYMSWKILLERQLYETIEQEFPIVYECIFKSPTLHTIEFGSDLMLLYNNLQQEVNKEISSNLDYPERLIDALKDLKLLYSLQQYGNVNLDNNEINFNPIFSSITFTKPYNDLFQLRRMKNEL